MKVTDSAGAILESDHGELDELLRGTMSALESADASLVFERLDHFWARLAVHIRAEHVKLFPAVREFAIGRPDAAELHELLDRLRHDHDFFMRGLARAVKAMRLVFSFGNEAETLVMVREILAAVEERLAVHNGIEEETIYPLSGSFPLEQKNFAETIRRELQNSPARFAGRQKRW